MITLISRILFVNPINTRVIKKVDRFYPMQRKWILCFYYWQYFYKEDMCPWYYWLIAPGYYFVMQYKYTVSFSTMYEAYEYLNGLK
jgi:hypothetical protein